MKIITYLICVFTLGLTAQNPRNFKFEDSTTINNYINEQQLAFLTEDIYILKTIEDYKTYTSEGNLVSPVIFVFNEKGEFTEYINFYNAEKKLSNLKRLRKKKSKNSPDFKYWEEKIVSLKTNQVYTPNQTGYIFVLSWGIHWNKIKSAKLISKWYEVLLRQKENNPDIQLILLNTDLQDSWDISQETKDWMLEQVNNPENIRDNQR